MNLILITGGAGFIGVNAGLYFSRNGWDIIVLDNLSRKGSEVNLKWLQDQISFRFERVDVRDQENVEKIISKTRPNALLHLAAQVAVTTSIEKPREDFEINAVGTFNLLEAVRKYSPDTFFINVSTNKVYGKMEKVEITERNQRYEYKHLLEGVDEHQSLDFHSPYGCSKGIADQYTIDYSRIYGIRSVSFRQSCIYGQRQFGIEDQGWVAWFCIASLLGKNITIYGDGKQIRDVLNVNDLVRLYHKAIENQESANGQAFNIGGGPKNTISLLELINYLEKELGNKIHVEWSNLRPGDQPVFVCNINKARNILNWSPQISVYQGITNLINWVRENKNLF